jgi:predicted nuclease with TOPRIM domain
MENFRVNSCKKEDKRGILQGQQIKESYNQFKSELCELDKKNFEELLKEKDETIAELYKEITELKVENSRLIELHNRNSLNNGIEAEGVTESFLTENYEGYDLDVCANAYAEANKVIM